VGRGQLGEAGLAVTGELEAHDPLVLGVGDPPEQAGCLGPVDEIDGAVVAQQQVSCDVAELCGRAGTTDLSGERADGGGNSGPLAANDGLERQPRASPRCVEQATHRRAYGMASSRS
jgi:hypothetical protein